MPIDILISRYIRRQMYGMIKLFNTIGGKEMNEAIVLNPTRLILAALIGLVLLLVLIIKFKIHAMISILIGAITIGIVAGMPFTEIVTACK